MDKIAVLKVYNLEFDHCTHFLADLEVYKKFSRHTRKLTLLLTVPLSIYFKATFTVKTFLRNKLEAQFQWGGAA